MSYIEHVPKIYFYAQNNTDKTIKFTVKVWMKITCKSRALEN